MKHINIFGLFMVIIIMIPNIVFAYKNKDGFKNYYNNKMVECIENISRIACFLFMAFHLEGFGFSSDNSFALYLIIDFLLVTLYCLIWIFTFKNNSLFRSLSLSVIPSVLFIFSAFISHNILLMISSVSFAPCHILISVKNFLLSSNQKKTFSLI